MKYFTSLLLLLLSLVWTTSTIGQTVNFEDGFEDGDFSNNPTWTGDPGDFTVAADIPNYFLQLDAVGPSPSYLSVPSSNVNGFWEFYVEFRGFEPSGSNQAEIFLMSDIANLEGLVNGYAVQVGESGDDFFRIVRYDNGAEAATVLSGSTVVESGGGYTIRITRDSSGNWQMEVAEDYGLFSSTTTNGTDNTHTSASYFGTKVSFTSTRSDKFYFDFKIDLPPFTTANARLASQSSVDIAFNRAVDQATVETTDFSFNKGVGTPASVSFPASDTVRLDFNEALPSNKYVIDVTGVRDQSGNTIQAGTNENLIVFGDYVAGDIKINEFAYDPPTGQEEYIELINTSSKYLDLINWEIGDETGTDDLGSDQIILKPNSFLAISTDTTALFNTFGDRPYYEANSLASFNNSGDAVKLITDTGDLVDSLSYTPDWGGTDRALERRSSTTSSTYPENWDDSPHPNGGTPGFANEISTDQTPPFFEELYAADATKLQLIFSERITSSSATNKQNYQISPNRGIQLIAAKEDSVKLILDQELISEQDYVVTTSNISDIFGNTLSGANRKTTFLKIDEAQPQDIVINEILYNPNSEQADFIELYNSSNKNFDLTGWSIGDASTETSISKKTQLLSGEHLVLVGDDVFASSISNAVDVSGFPALNTNSGDAVYLKTDKGRTIDSLQYSPAWGGSEDGTSLERKDPNAASNDDSNWQTSTSNNGHSAGSKNTAFQKDTSPPKLIFSKQLSGGDIELRFNEFIELTDDVEFLMDDQELIVSEFESTNADVIVLTSPPSKRSAPNDATIIVQNFSDVKGNTTTSSEIAVAQPLQPSKIVVNEIMYNPLNDPEDNKADQGEYIELRNTQDYAVSLEGLYLHDAPDEDGDIRELQPISSTAKWVPAQGKALVHADPAETFAESKVANFFDIESPKLRSVMRVNRSSLSLSSTDDAIFIADSNGTTIDSVFYDETWHNPNLIDTRGIALERVSPGGASNDDSNWGSSVNIKGGTPNKENSLYQENIKQSKETGISFTPNPFSPDSDGYEDNLFINYNLDQQDYLIKVRIYDRYGRLVRKLADGKQAGLEGQLIWDGRKNDGSRNRIGIYIVVFEAYDSTSGEDRSFKKTVVLARKLN